MIVGAVEKYLAENKTETQIVKELEVFCSLLPSRFTVKCDNIVDNYVPMIIELLEKYETPEKICSQIGLCDSHNDIKCSACKFLVSTIEGWVSDNKTETQIEKLLEKVCSALPSSYQNVCDTLIEEYLPIVIEYLKSLVPPEQICTLIGLCTDMTNAPVLECTACKFLVGAIEGWVADNATETVIEKELEKICNLLPSSYQKICDTIIDEYLPVIINYVEKHETPDKICQLIKMCPKTQIKHNSIIACDGCKLMTEVIEEWLEDGKTESEIMKDLDKLCDMLPKYGDLCDVFVSKLIPQVIAFIVSHETPDTICHQLHFC
jgi:saposin